MAQVYLPDPKLVIGRRRFWERGAIRRYIATAAGEGPPPPRPDDEHLIGSAELRHILGGVSDMWLWRHSRRASREEAAA